VAQTTDCVVIKIGGSTLGQHDTTLQDIVTVQQRGIASVVVHGGGKVVSDWLTRLGIQPTFVAGQRVTDERTLDVVIAVLAGLVNKRLVVAINALGGKSIGISGIDGGLIKAMMAKKSLGLVGDVEEVNTSVLTAALGAGFVPVVAPVSVDLANSALMLNVNADMVASHIALALNARQLIFMTDVPGIRDSSGRTLSSLTKSALKELISSGAARDGMAVKGEACLKALTGVSAVRVIDGTAPHSLVRCLDGDSMGTTMVRG
jgi:acetylglutamate kinase